MIYSVDLALGPEQSDEDWKQWVAVMKTPHDFIVVAGFQSMQRFKEMTRKPYRYLALYNVPSAEAVTNGEYRSIDGGNLRKNTWKPLITLWHRNVFDGTFRVPAVTDDQVLIVVDAKEPRQDGKLPQMNWIQSVALEKSTPYRGIAVLPRTAAKQWIENPVDGVLVYAPTMPQANQENTPKK